VFSKIALALLLLVAACGDLPRPYQGQPGATARRLAQPPPARLAIPPSYSTYLPSIASKPFSEALANALQSRAVPAVADYAKSGDWRIDLGVTTRGDMTMPTFTVVDPSGNRKGTEEGKPLPTEVWRKGSPAVLKEVAEEAAPRVLALMERVEAARRQSDPNSLYNRNARVMVVPVTGAPGDGNVTLTRLMRDKLAKLGPVVQETATGSDFTLSAKVDYAPLTPKTHRIEIVWLLHDPRNNEVGHIVQLNEVPNGLLDKFWGDVAVVVTDEASGAIRDVIMTQSGRRDAGAPQQQPAASKPPADKPTAPAEAQPAAAPAATQQGPQKPGAQAKPSQQAPSQQVPVRQAPARRQNTTPVPANPSQN